MTFSRVSDVGEKHITGLLRDGIESKLVACDVQQRIIKKVPDGRSYRSARCGGIIGERGRFLEFHKGRVRKRVGIGCTEIHELVGILRRRKGPMWMHRNCIGRDRNGATVLRDNTINKVGIGIHLQTRDCKIIHLGGDGKVRRRPRCR